MVTKKMESNAVAMYFMEPRNLKVLHLRQESCRLPANRDISESY